MTDLRFKPEAIFEFQTFIRHYEQAFFELYSDSGVWNEDLIIRSYRESAQKLYLTILVEIQNRLKVKKVFGRKPSDFLSEIDFYVGNRLVIVYYSEDKKQKVRVVESISIDRKPIIF